VEFVGLGERGVTGDEAGMRATVVWYWLVCLGAVSCAAFRFNAQQYAPPATGYFGKSPSPLT